jgi:hypothetical protein
MTLGRSWAATPPPSRHRSVVRKCSGMFSVGGPPRAKFVYSLGLSLNSSNRSSYREKKAIGHPRNAKRHRSGGVIALLLVLDLSFYFQCIESGWVKRHIF